MADLARRPAEGLQEFLDRAEEFVNQEETLHVFRGIEEVAKENPATDRKLKQRATPVRKEVADRRLVKRVENYN